MDMSWVKEVSDAVWGWGPDFLGGPSLMVILLLGSGIFLTLRLGFIQLRRLGHGFAVTAG